ncbi:uncharacterized protein LOC143921046 [Arctopsyche grandis]|uniref:uncharacterized protein LOC143921046 n=1 Tax=Arctopsyche grandis TaxID=121162 RepID=UPI00406D9484
MPIIRSVPRSKMDETDAIIVSLICEEEEQSTKTKGFGYMLFQSHDIKKENNCRKATPSQRHLRHVANDTLRQSWSKSQHATVAQYVMSHTISYKLFGFVLL